MIATESSIKPLINYYLEIEDTVYRLKTVFCKQESSSYYAETKKREITILEKCLFHLQEDPVIDLWIQKRKFKGLL